MSDLVLGFTGTRRGMTLKQRAQVISVINRFQPHKARHGDCKGSDEEFNEVCWLFGIPIETHPPKDDSLRAFCERGVVKVWKEEEYLVRDRVIVRKSNLIVGTPLSRLEEGGTWYTLNYAKSYPRDYIICHRDGEMALSRVDLFNA